MKLHRAMVFAAWTLATLMSFTLAANASAEGSFQRTLTVTGPVNLDVSTGSGRSQVRTGGSGQVQVVGHIKASDWFGSPSAEEKVQRMEKNP